jgi:hypothetical protein
MLNLRIGLTKNPRFEPLIDGRLKSSEVTLACTVTTPPEGRSVGDLYFEGDNSRSHVAMLGDAPFLYGVGVNRKMLEMLAASSHAEGLTRQMARIDELFADATLES